MSGKPRNSGIKIIALLCILNAGIILASHMAFGQESQAAEIGIETASGSEAEKESEESSSLTAQVDGAAKTFTLGGSARSTQYANWQEVGAQAAAPAGSGTSKDPFKIGSGEELAWFMYQINSGNIQYRTSHVVLTADIDLTGADYGGSEDQPLPWEPITNYQGIFDGGEHTICRIYCSKPSVVEMGFFRALGGSAVVRNLRMDQGFLEGYTKVGLIGNVSTSSNPACTIENVVNLGVEIKGDKYLGGILGNIETSAYKTQIKECTNYANITSSRNMDAGGILGRSMGKAEVSDCYNQGTAIGGIVGLYRTINGTDYLEIKNCYNAGTVLNSPDAEIMPISSDSDHVYSISNCYYDSKTTETAEENGIRGLKSETLKSMEAIDLLNGNREGESPWYLPGKKSDYDETKGYPGFQKTEITSAADWKTYLLESGGTEYNLAGTYYFPENGRISFEEITESGTDFNGNLIGNGSEITGIQTPLFQKITGGGEGGVIENLNLTAKTGGIQIASGQSDGSFGMLCGSMSGSMRVSGVSASGALTSAGHYANGIGGLIGKAEGSTAGSIEVKNCSTNVAITVNGSETGGVSGGLIGSVKNLAISGSYASGAVTGDNGSTGGLVGRASGSTINTSYASGDVTGSGALSAIGGLIGAEESAGSGITNCYASGRVSAAQSTNAVAAVGGLVGTAYSPITNCYTSSRIDPAANGTAGGVIGGGTGSVTNSYYDKQIAGQVSTVSNAGAPLLTSEMVGKGLETKGFDSTIWAFTADSTANALSSYPRLSGFTDDAAFASVTALSLHAKDLSKDVIYPNGEIQLSTTYGADNTSTVKWSYSDNKITMDGTTHKLSHTTGRFPVGTYTLTAACGTASRTFTLDLLRQVLQVSLLPVDTLNPVRSEAVLTYVNGENYSSVETKQMESDFTTEASEQDLIFTACTTINTNYSLYGTDNANKNVGFALLKGSTEADVMPGTAGSGVTGIRLYNAAAYNRAEPRYVKVKFGTVEVWVTIEGISVKKMDAVMPLNPSITLNPGMTDTAYTDDYSFKNNTAFPMDVQIKKVEPVSNETYQLSLVKGKTEIESVDNKNLTNAGVTLSIINPEGGDTTFENHLLSSGNSTVYQLSSQETFSFRYRMEYNPLFLGAGDSTFGYTITQSVSVSKEDDTGGN